MEGKTNNDHDHDHDNNNNNYNVSDDDDNDNDNDSDNDDDNDNDNDSDNDNDNDSDSDSDSNSDSNGNGSRGRRMHRMFDGARVRKTTTASPSCAGFVKNNPKSTRNVACHRAGWVSMLLLEWLTEAVQPPGSRTRRDFPVVLPRVGKRAGEHAGEPEIDDCARQLSSADERQRKSRSWHRGNAARGREKNTAHSRKKNNTNNNII